MSKRHQSKRRKNRHLLKLTAIFLAVIILVCGILFSINLWERYADEYKESEKQDLFSQIMEYDGKEYTLNESIETILFIGLDKFEHPDEEAYTNDMQADFLLLLVIDNQSKKCSAVHINRDTVARMSVLGLAGDRVDTVYQQIALAHTYGNGREISCRNTLEAVSNMLLNIDINHYVSVTMDAVSAYNDFVDGVEVTVLDDFTGIDDTLVKGEKVVLKGNHALNYVRTRYGLEDSSNSHRMKRQKQYLEALYEKTVRYIENDKDFVLKAASAISSDLVSDCSANRLQSVAEKISKYEFNGIYDIDGETKMGEVYMEFYPDSKSVEEMIVKLFYMPVS